MVPGRKMVVGEAKDFKFGIQVDRGEYQRTHDRLPLNRASSGSRDLLIFGK